MARVFVAMSGGVDSSVAAALLCREGHDVTGVTMQLLPSGGDHSSCCTHMAIRDARSVCDVLGIPHYVLNVRDVFRDEVIGPFRDAYAAGRTPNPCVTCNDRVKFVELWRRASLQGAEFLATGHYGRIVRDSAGEPWLARGADPTKDQSYFLYRMTALQLARTLFPLGELTKSETRRLAASLGLPTASKRDSQEICFVPAVGQAAFVAAAHSEAAKPGPIVDAGGRRIGTHRGLAAYTVGQRSGLGVAAPRPLYVLALRPEENAVVAGPVEDLAVTRVTCTEAVWRGPASADVGAQVRYRQRAVEAKAAFDGERLRVEFARPVAGVAPGQSLVCYNGEVVMGGGVVEQTA